MQVSPPVLANSERLLPGFLWYLWARGPQGHLKGVQVADTIVLVNGRPKAWVFYSQKAGRVRSTVSSTALQAPCNVIKHRQSSQVTFIMMCCTTSPGVDFMHVPGCTLLKFMQYALRKCTALADALQCLRQMCLTCTALLQILCKKSQNTTLQAVHAKFTKGRKSYDPVATFTSPYRPSHLSSYPSWITDGVAMKGGVAENYVQYLSPRGLQDFLRMVCFRHRCGSPINFGFATSRGMQYVCACRNFHMHACGCARL